MKLCLTSLDILATVKELSSALISARIENVYQLDTGDFLFKVHARDGPLALIVTPGMRINITRFKYPIPDKPSPRASNLRRLLNDSKIESVGQVDFDRILYLETRSSEGKCWTYFELFGDGNVIVADEAGIIRFALESRSMKDRTLRLGVRYLPPPQRGHALRSDDLPLDAVRSQNVNLIRATTRVFNIPPEVAEEALHRSSLDANSPAS
ncbi:MAG TPA: NFACT family protein, partial [Candidatus Methanomethylicus sp.]|nr:NFACT family protein [Candidatus Methanomethylicus sp.]